MIKEMSKKTKLKKNGIVNMKLIKSCTCRQAMEKKRTRSRRCVIICEICTEGGRVCVNLVLQGRNRVDGRAVISFLRSFLVLAPNLVY